MGYKIIELKLPTDYNEGSLRQIIATRLRLKEFTFQVEHKSLDARKKGNIHWLLRVAVHAQDIGGGETSLSAKLAIPYKKRNKRILITGSGPAGFFAAMVLQEAGFETIILERGSEVNKREEGIRNFEATGNFDPGANYSFGEGGAGTFSDGKLTSRTKHISKEREYVLSSYVAAGAPAEILYMAYPHVGSDNLKVVVQNLRAKYISLGGQVKFETFLRDIDVLNGMVTKGSTDDESIHADYFIIAPGHSAYETYRMLMARGVIFRTKNFAIGCRAEHTQQVINMAQWGRENLPGVKAAEYRLTSDADGRHPVYSFCMCPGGMVVPAATYKDMNIVNGMSNYQRGGRFANAACVAGIHPDQLAGRSAGSLEALKWLEELERSFYTYTNTYRAPFCTIDGFIKGEEPKSIPETSYPLGLQPAPLWNMLPSVITHALRLGLADFCRKIRGYESGILLGLESKTSSPIQVLREKSGLCQGFHNLYLAGEGSGYAGGIISSAADGIKTAFRIIEREQ